MKKTFIALVVSAFACLSLAAFAACEENGNVTVEHIETVAATADVHGTAEHWKKGDRLYSDEACTTEISEVDLVVHNYSTEWSNDEDSHFHSCTVVGCTAKADEAAHVAGEWQTTKAATETEEGSRRKVCTTCDYETETEAIAKLPVHVTAESATDTEHGNIEYWIKDGVTYSDEACTQETSVVVHNYSAEWSNDENFHFHVCTVAGCTAHDKDIAHDYSTAGAVTAATCTEDGHTEYSCTCGETTQKDIIGKLGHNIAKSVFVADGNATHGGLFWKYCDTCKQNIEAFDANAYYDRTVKITMGGTETEYGAYTCYTGDNLNSSIVTFDALASNGLFIIDASQLSGEVTITYTNTPIKLLVNSDTSVTSLTYTEWGNALAIDGSGALTVSGAYSVRKSEVSVNVTVGSVSGDVELTLKGGTFKVNGDMSSSQAVQINESATLEVSGALSLSSLTINGTVTAASIDNYNNAATITVNDGSLSVAGAATLSTLNVYGGTFTSEGLLIVANFTVGSSESEATSTVVAKSGVTNNGLWGAPVAAYNFVKGNVYIIGSGTTAIDLKSTGENIDNITVESGATVSISGFTYGMNSDNAKGILTVRGTVTISANYGLYRMNTTVDGGTLGVLSGEWGIYCGTATFDSGTALLQKNSTDGWGAFKNVTQLSVTQACTLKVKGYNQIISCDDGITCNVTAPVKSIVFSTSGTETQYTALLGEDGQSKTEDDLYVSGTIEEYITAPALPSAE